ncbi:MAG: S8 family serine peptidase [Solirubrobacteraceae bacterium MAG38_C4-C5]|nr:S8 family serine peptidase [Candidatus Siliceabacter maunaloa]
MLAAPGSQPAAPMAPPTLLPPEGRAARAVESTWLIGAARGARSAAIARDHGARALEVSGVYVVSTPQTRSLAAALRAEGLLRFSEPDHVGRREDAEDDFTNWRSAVVPPGLASPPVDPDGPLVAVLDSPVDLAHPDLNGVQQSAPGAPFDEHGTAVASMVSAARNGFGMVGVWPGAQTLVIPTGDATGIACSESVDAIFESVLAGATVINMSYGSPEQCFAQELALGLARTNGIVSVAASGNEFQEGNAPSFPAASPHVLSVAATDPAGNSSAFSTANAAVDLSAPGEQVVAAVPGGGHALVDGTSFSAPIVSGVAGWVRDRRPDLDAGQAADLLRITARDIDEPGFDDDTGFGLVDLPAALDADAPRGDAREVNDDIGWVNGDFFDGDPEPYSWDGGRRGAIIRASADFLKDPVDVYRIRVPAGQRVRVLVKPLRGDQDPDLEVFARSADTVFEARGSVGDSVREAGRSDVVRFTNRLNFTRQYFVAVYVPEEAETLNAEYTLTVRRDR